MTRYKVYLSFITANGEKYMLELNPMPTHDEAYKEARKIAAALFRDGHDGIPVDAVYLWPARSIRTPEVPDAPHS